MLLLTRFTSKFNAESNLILVLLTWFISRAQNCFQKILDWTTIWPLFRSSSVASRAVEYLKTKHKLQNSVTETQDWEDAPARLLHFRWSADDWLTLRKSVTVTKRALLQKRTDLFWINFFWYGSTFCRIIMVTRCQLKHLKKGFMKWKLKLILCSNQALKIKNKYR